MIAQPDFITTAIKLFSALLLVLGLFMGGVYLLRRVVKRDGTVPGGKLIRVIDRSYIGVKKSVTLVKCPARFWFWASPATIFHFWLRLKRRKTWNN